MKPKVFISYSWSSPGHQARVRHWAEQLVNDGVDVIIDVWDLAEGDDKYAFMERMVTDESVTHVLAFCDSVYATKADARKAGVGTESQIISQEVYEKVKQSKFIPVVCELDESSEPFLPAVFKNRIWIDFSSAEAANENWEQLIRVLYGKPAHQKPTLGKAPTYVTSDAKLSVSTAGVKLVALRQAIIQGKSGLNLYRQDFLDACFEYADALRVRTQPDEAKLGQRVLEDCGKLKIARDEIVAWVLLESSVTPSDEFNESLITLLERLLELKSRPPEVTFHTDTWFEAHRIFVYETFLYIVASLLKTGSFDTLHQVMTTHYFAGQMGGSGLDRFRTFDVFLGFSVTLQILAPTGRSLLAPAAELIKRQADRTDVPFADIMQAELLILMMAMITEGTRWYPQTLLYSTSYAGYPFFVKATRHRDFQKLAQITGIGTGEDLRAAVKKGQARLNTDAWHDFSGAGGPFWHQMNMDGLDTLT